MRMGWTLDERLVIVNDQGMVYLYRLYGDFEQFSLGKLAKDNGVIDCKIWSGGLVALTGNYKMIAVSSFDEENRRPRQLADPGIDSAPHSWAIIPPEHAMTRHVEVIIATGKTVKVVDFRDTVDQKLQQGPFTNIDVSPNGRFIALYSQDGKVWVVSADLQNNLSEFTTDRGEEPSQVVWCGNNSVVLSWSDEVVMVGPFGETLNYSFDDAVHLVTSMDGLLIVGSETCDFLEKVSDATEAAFRIGSTAPPAMLLDASEHYENKSPKADEHIRALRKGEHGDALLVEAVEACIEAATREFSQHWQRKLLRAASFGKSFLEGFNADSFVETCKNLRVINAVRAADVGMPITYEQFNSLTAKGLVNRLVNRHQHLIAYRICEYLKLRPENVLVEWACAKVRGSKDDEETLCRIIVSKLTAASKQSGGGISYATIAKTASDVGQSRLATRLLDYEARARDQVPLLLTMSEYDMALTKAIDSGDPDLVHSVLLHLRKYLSLAEFFRCINDKPRAVALLEAWCDTGATRKVKTRRNTDDDDKDIINADRELLRDYYYQDDRRIQGAMLALDDADNEVSENANNAVGKIKIAAKLLSDEGRTDATRLFDAKSLDDAAKLLALQRSLEKDREKLASGTNPPSLIGMSVSETLREVLTWGYNAGGDAAKIAETKWAAKIRSEFKVPDKRYWWIRLRALVDARDWEGVDRFAAQGALGATNATTTLGVFAGGSSSRKAPPPIGWRPFVEELIKARQVARAKTWIAKCEPVSDRIQLWIRVGEWKKAGEEAFAIKDGQMLRQIRSRCPNTVIGQEIDGLIAQLK